MKKIFLYLSSFFVFPAFLFAQTQHFTFTANTGDSYSIVVNAATLDGASLTVGDEIGVVTPNDLCVGASVWDGNTPLALVAWIDDSQTPNVVDGYAAGDSMFFKIWQQSSDEEFDADPTYEIGNGRFGDGAFAQLSLAAISGGGTPENIIVHNTNDSGEGSLREAINTANTQTGPDTIIFNIPQNDAGFNSDNGAWTIQPLSPLPAISDSGVVIDGSSQEDFIGSDSNPDGPEIVLNGSQVNSSAHGLQIFSANNVVESMVINGFGQSGIFISGENAHENRILGNYLGTAPTGTAATPNTQGVIISAAPRNVIGGSEPGEGNILSGNRDCGLLISGQMAVENEVMGNHIGTVATGDAELGNEGIGLCIFSFASDNVVGGSGEGERNLISGNKNDGIRIAGDDNIVMGNYIGTDITGSAAIGNLWDGIGIWGGEENRVGGIEPGQGNLISGNSTGVLIHSNHNIVSGNLIGTDISGNELGNQFSGIHFSAGAKMNTIGPENVIAFNGINGVTVFADTTFQNTITQNSITENGGHGIENKNGGNKSLAPPANINVNSGAVTGTSLPNSTVEIFSDDNDEGKIYEGTTTADASGNFQWNGTPTGPFVTATATDTAGNTSQFSQPRNITSVEETAELTIPEEFSLSQNYPNPFNPVTKILFALPSRSKVTLKVYNLLGEALLTLIDEEMPAGIHNLIFNGEQLSSGVYFYRLQATNPQNGNSFTQTRKLTLLK